MVITRLKSFCSLIKMVMLMHIRSRVVLILVLSISMPIAMATAVSLSTTLLHEQAKAVAELVELRPSIILVDTDGIHEDCVAVDVVNARIAYDGHSFYAQVHIVRELNRYLDTLNIKLRNRSSFQDHILSIGEATASRYGIDIGRRITICLSRQCFNLTVQAIHRGHGFLNYVVITDSSVIHTNSTIHLCLSTANPSFVGILQSVSKNTRTLLDFFSITIPLSYVPIVFIAINRVIDSYKNDIALLTGLGVSRRELALCFISVLILAVYIFALYGVALGTVVFYLSTWILKLIGVPVFARPLPSIDLAVILPVTYVPSVVLSIFLVFARLGEEP